jgi:hypothetical protein
MGDTPMDEIGEEDVTVSDNDLDLKKNYEKNCSTIYFLAADKHRLYKPHEETLIIKVIR